MMVRTFCMQVEVVGEWQKSEFAMPCGARRRLAWTWKSKEKVGMDPEVKQACRLTRHRVDLD